MPTRWPHSSSYVRMLPALFSAEKGKLPRKGLLRAILLYSRTDFLFAVLWWILCTEDQTRACRIA